MHKVVNYNDQLKHYDVYMTRYSWVINDLAVDSVKSTYNYTTSHISLSYYLMPLWHIKFIYIARKVAVIYKIHPRLVHSLKLPKYEVLNISTFLNPINYHCEFGKFVLINFSLQIVKLFYCLFSDCGPVDIAFANQPGFSGLLGFTFLYHCLCPPSVAKP